MKLKTIWTAALCLGLMALGGDRLAAADKAQASAQQELKAKMAAQDWKEISQGVFERQRGTNKVEHLGYGREGLVWTIDELTRQHDALMEEYQRHPSEDLHKVIDRLSVKIADAKRELRNTKNFSNVSEAVATGCSICYGVTVDAYPLSGGSQGVGAIADANFSSSCGSSGDTYAYAYARATLDGTTTTHTVEDPHTGTSVTSHAEATAYGTTDCFSSASAFAQSSDLGISYSASQTNSSCPPPPLPPPTITGPAKATIDGISCQTLTWSATPNGGAAPFSYAWTIDGVPAGTGSSVSKPYCGNNTARSQSVNVALTVTDSTSQTASNSFSTAITYTAVPPPTVTIAGPSTATINGTNCQTLTWSATASGGITPYSYAWIIDGAPAGTGSSVSKNYCGNNTAHSQTVNVAVTVTDAAGQTGTSSSTTTITYTAIPPLRPNITVPGPTTISGSNCKILTWSVTASGGTPPYSYAWTLDGVAAGTGTSISKSYCGNNVAHSQTVNAAVTVTDSGTPPQTATASGSTVITYTAIPPPTTNISGSATTTIAGTNCKTLTWTATTSGGTTPYSYAWKIAGVAAGTSSSTSVSKSYCGNNTAHSQSVSVTLTVTDSSSPSQTASDSFTTTITYTVVAVPTVTISSTTPVLISGVACKTITWTSTVSGGTSPYTYAWKIDGVAAGSATSASKSYCGSNTDTTQTVNATLAVTDAASQTGSASYTTTINYTSVGGTGGCLINQPSCLGH